MILYVVYVLVVFLGRLINQKIIKKKIFKRSTTGEYDLHRKNILMHAVLAEPTVERTVEMSRVASFAEPPSRDSDYHSMAIARVSSPGECCVVCVCVVYVYD